MRGILPLNLYLLTVGGERGEFEKQHTLYYAFYL
jgi:hypothetical protein